MTDDGAEPSAFITRSLPAIVDAVGPEAKVLDVAMGAGRHVLLLARAGFTVFGVDRDFGRLRRAADRLSTVGKSASVWVTDLESCVLPSDRFDLVVCTRYLQRSLWEALRNAVRPRGFVLYETFTVNQRRYDWGPRSPDHLLRTGGELREAFCDWEVWRYEESESPSAEARLLARRPGLPSGLI